MGVERAALVIAIIATACTTTIPNAPHDADGGVDAPADAMVDAITDPVTGCPNGPDVYSPYRAPGMYPKDTVTALPWHGLDTAYPSGDENFTNYGPTLPAMVECGDDKRMRSYVDVTAGCLMAVSVGSYTRGQIQPTPDGYYRSIALGYVAGDPLPIKWTDQSVEYRFYYTGKTGDTGNPGFKAFARYRTEDDLYVASWRSDGVAQIQKKHCGEYTPLIILDTFGAPTPNVWHTIRFDAIGNKLDLYLDHALVASAIDPTFSWGTAGIRIDSMSGAYITDWRVFGP